MLDEEESERVYERENVLENLLKRTKESLANEQYNDIIFEGLDEYIPYMGAFWRNCDFIGKYVVIGKDNDNKIGIMVNNKWDYPERRMTDTEVDTFMALIDRVIVVDHGFSNDIVFYRTRRLEELRKWVQELSI